MLFARPAFGSNYFTHVWQAGEGLPQNAVTAIVQTKDGYLWLGTYSGLAQFDGVKFVVFDNNNTPEMHSSRVTSLFEDAAAELWIGFETGELTRYRNGRFQPVEMVPNWNGRRILAITADEAGDIWVLGADGMMARLRDGLMLSPESGGAENVTSLARDKHGTVWVVRNGKISMLQGGRLTPAPFNLETDGGYVQGICASSDGGMWIAGANHVRLWRDGAWGRDLGPVPWGPGQALAFKEIHDGGLAVGVVDQGLVLMMPTEGVLYFNRSKGLPSDWVRALCEDQEGNLWIGTGSGLAVLRAGKVATINPPDQWQNGAVLSISAAPDGSMWFGTEGAGLYQLSNGDWTRYGAEQGVSNLFVWSATLDAQGRIWAGTWGGGLFRKDGTRFELVPGLADVRAPVPAMLQLPDGSTWLGTGAGLVHYQDGRSQSYGINEGLQFPDVRAVVQDREGTVWFGMFGGGLGCLRQNVLKQFRKADGLSSDFVQCLRFDDDGSLWIGTFGGGINRLKQGRFATIGIAQGLPNNTICGVEDDGRANFWFSSYGGIFRVAKAALNRCADGASPTVNCLAYGIGDGMPTLECSGGFQPSGCKTSDGRIWFPTSKGVVVVDPNEVKVNRLPPPVVIEELLVDGHRVPKGAEGARLRIPAGQNRFEFRYTGLSFVVPEKVRFKYMLEGLETEWVEESKRQANYSYIPPGDYTFRVIACNNDDQWNDDGATLSFTMLPHFWQTWWFRVLTGALAVAAASSVVWFDMRRRMHVKLERLERQRAIERERERIAKDIHDDLGASLTRITMLSQSARSSLDDPGQAAANLDRIYGTARELTRAMDEIVWAVNPKHDTLDSLASYLGKYAQDFLGTASVRCRLDLPVQLPAWHLTAEVRHTLFLAFKEALNNVVKHAGASEVRASLVLQPPGFVLAVEDNGCGFASPPPGTEPADPDLIADGNGLANMRKRLEEIGGRCEIQSTPGQGTQVRFTVPVNLSQQPPRDQRGPATVSLKLMTPSPAESGLK